MSEDDEPTTFGEILEDIFPKRTPEEDIKSLRETVSYQRANFNQKIKEEREARSFLVKRVRKLEQQMELVVMTVLIGVGGYLFSQISHYWKLGEWWNVVIITGFMVLVVKVFNDAQKDPK